MPFDHPSGLPAAYDRADADAARARLVWSEGTFIQGADLNEAQTISERRDQRLGNMVAKDGDRLEGASIVINADEERATLAAGRIYIAGDVRPVPAAVINDFPLTGERLVGVRLQRATVTSDDDATLLGLHPGTEAEGEPGAARVRETLVWAMPDDEQAGQFFTVYQVRDGVVVDQAPPPSLSGVLQQIGVYDFDALGNYAVGDGCLVTALGKIGSDQVFSISAGTANIRGFKRTREAAARFAEPEEPDLETVTAEPITMTGPTGGTHVLTVGRAPISGVSAAVIVKRITQTVTRSAVVNGADPLTFSSVVAVESVVQGGTTYIPSTDYVLSSGSISWAPAGAEPSASSTYTVTYLYNDSVTPTAVTDTTVTVEGGVNGQLAQITYTSKVPRIDVLGLDVTGRPVYLKGIAARQGALAPIAPSSVLKLAEISNSWIGPPVVSNNGTRNYTFDAQRRLFGRLIDVLDQFQRQQLRSRILEAEPVSKNGIFTDDFADDFFRDAGAAQTAAIDRGSLSLAIDNVLMQRAGTNIETLAFTEEVVLSQPLRTSGMLINPYDNFTPFPAGMQIEPAVDFWTDIQTDWASDVTREFQTAPNVPPGTTTIIEQTELRRTVAPELRQIAIAVTIEGFGVGENLATLTMDGIDVKPAGTQTANGSGVIALSFTIPASMPAGRRPIRATGAVGSFAQTVFVGEGTVDIQTLRRVHLVAREAPPPPAPTFVFVPEAQQVWQPVVWDNGGGGGGGAGDPDPLAQSFALAEGRLVIGVNFRFTFIGNRANGVRIQISPMVNGFPSNEVLAEAFVNMATPVVGDLIEARFRAPVYLDGLQQYCVVVLTADPDHAVAIARLGDVYDLPGGGQARVSSQPYTVGVLFASANRISWTAIQEADLHFEIVAAKFAPTTRTINLWTGALTNISDIMVRGGVELPTDAAGFRYELVRATGQVIPLAPGQNRPFAEFLNETVTVRAVLTGTEKISPILYPGTLIVGGRIRTSGTYITRLFPMGSAVRLAAVLSQFTPAGSTVTVEQDNGGATWNALTAGTSTLIGNNWSDVKYERDPVTAANGRVRITLAGGPAARPAVAALRAYTV
jgi:hypothetical protein